MQLGEFADGRNEESPDSEQIDPTVAEPHWQNSVSVENERAKSESGSELVYCERSDKQIKDRSGAIKFTNTPCQRQKMSYNSDMIYHNLNKCKLTFAKQTEIDYSPFTTHNSLKSTAFTLAEVLITLGIIGVVAAITMPVLINKYQKIVTVNKLKKNYSLFSQVFKMAERDFDSAKYWDYSLNSNVFAEKYFLPYLPTAKKYNTKYSISALGGKKDSLRANILSTGFGGVYMYSLPDGTLFGPSIDPNGPYILAQIIVDLNGIKGPNVAGKDVFYFSINQSKGQFEMLGQGKDRNTVLLPGDLEEQSWISNCAPANSTYAGTYCGYVIMQDGWKIAPDYPW